MVDTPAGDARLLADAAAGSNAPAQSVSELAGALKRTVEDRFGHVRVRGEISGFKRAASGHCYLCLKDDAAVIDAVVWKGAAAAMRFRPEDGIEVIATGRLTTYPGRSKYQIVVERMEIAGAGALMALLDARRRALAAEGLFDAARKRPLPFLPRVIGVVTSPSGAVIRDIIHRVEDRCPTRVIVWPVPVQGDAAAPAVAAAVAGFDALPADGPVARPDLLIVARGGGSIEDLWGFNEEAVVRAIAACSIPVISAVGHETDTTLADFAADVRAPTPTAAAEIAVPVRAELLATLREYGLRTGRCAHRYRERGAERLAATARRLPAPAALLGPQRQRLDELADRLPRALRHRITAARGELAHHGAALRPAVLAARLRHAEGRLASARLRPALLHTRLVSARERLDALWRLAAGLHPERPLARGYVRVTARDGRTLVTAADARRAGALSLHFADGTVAAKVEGRGRGPYADPDRQPNLL